MQKKVRKLIHFSLYESGLTKAGKEAKGRKQQLMPQYGQQGSVHTKENFWPSKGK